MKIVTTLDIPHEVYLFYLKVANHMENCTVENIMVDALQRYASMVSEEILAQRMQRPSPGAEKEEKH